MLSNANNETLCDVMKMFRHSYMGDASKQLLHRYFAFK